MQATSKFSSVLRARLEICLDEPLELAVFNLELLVGFLCSSANGLLGIFTLEKAAHDGVIHKSSANDSCSETCPRCNGLFCLGKEDLYVFFWEW